MNILPLRKSLEEYLKERQLMRKFAKQKKILEENIFHPGLNMELLEPRHMHLYSFRIDRKYRAVFIFSERETIEVIDISNHYR